MLGVILVGGTATRLKPLSNFMPKALFPFMNKPILAHQIEKLIESGVDEIILACGYKNELIEQFIQSTNYSVPIAISIEDEPMGTEGALKLALTDRDYSDGVFVLNGDIVCDMNLDVLRGSISAIALTKVDDPSRYGVCILDAASYISEFVEKPSSFLSPYINAGIYFLTESALSQLTTGFSMLEKSLFPSLAAGMRLIGLVYDGFWSDLGTPEAILDATLTKSDSTSINDRYAQNTIIYSSISPHAIIDNCSLNNVIVMEGAVLRNVTAQRAIIARNCQLIDSEVYNSVLADGASVERLICRGVLPAEK